MNKSKIKTILASCKKSINVIFDDADESRLTKDQMEEITSLISSMIDGSQEKQTIEQQKTTTIKSSVFKTGAQADERGAYVHTKSASEKFDQMNGR